mmetsp:Transcript_49477/g.115478  ORF Transcript_49477/g.115478 Transcript_49477/m.115478 type:complete len:262 (-) Transcript_49477:786-1571(-)
MMWSQSLLQGCTRLHFCVTMWPQAALTCFLKVHFSCSGWFDFAHVVCCVWPQGKVTSTSVLHWMAARSTSVCTLWQCSHCVWPHGSLASTHSAHSLVHTSSGRSPGQFLQGCLQTCRQPAGRGLVHLPVQITSLCSGSKGWHRKGQRCPHFGRRDWQCRWQPPCFAFWSKSSGVETMPSSCGCLAHRTFSEWQTRSLASSLPRTWNHLSSFSNMMLLPRIYIPCLARESATMSRFSIDTNPSFPLGLLRTSERMITSFSSP